MKNLKITLSLNEAGELIFSDNEGQHGQHIRPKVNKGGTVTWLCAPNSGIASIDAISKNADSQDVFKKDPAPVSPDNCTWEGEISETAEGEETYTISYTASSGDKCKLDPVIVVPPDDAP